MKQCPVCGRNYPAEYQFCEDDASNLELIGPLTTHSTEARVSTPQRAELSVPHATGEPEVSARPRSRVLSLVLGAVLLVALTICITVLAVGRRGGSAGVHTSPAIAAPSPSQSSIHLGPSSHDPPAPRPAAAGEASPSAPPANDLPVIGWGSDATSYERDLGRRFSFYCQYDGAHGSPVGTGVYATMSSICAAAVHAGIIPLSGGIVTIEIGDRRRGFSQSTRNGVTSHYSNRRRRTFWFVR